MVELSRPPSILETQENLTIQSANQLPIINRHNIQAEGKSSIMPGSIDTRKSRQVMTNNNSLKQKIFPKNKLKSKNSHLNSMRSSPKISPA